MHNPRPSHVFKCANTIMNFRPTLDKIEELSLICILSKGIYKLSILRDMLPYPQSTWPEGYMSVPLRMTRLEELTPPESREPESILTLKHVQTCRYFLQHLYEEMVNELSYQGTWNYLEYIICCETLRNYDDLMLKMENKNVNEVIQYLQNKLNAVRETFRETLLYLSDMTERCLEKAVVNAWVQSKTAVRYAEVSQQARLDQNNYGLKQREQTVQKVTNQNALDIEEETVINSEVENHLQYSITVLQKKLDSWTNKYNNEMDSLDVALLQIKSKVEEQRQQHETLLGQWNTRQVLVDEMQLEADERERQLTIRRLQVKAAARIQHWWRNILFRRNLKRNKIKQTSIKAGKNKTKKKR